MSESGPESPASGQDDLRFRPRVLIEIRENPRNRAVALAVAALVGVGLAWIHWFGLFLAGALVGLVSRDLPRALVAGAAVGGLVILATVLASPAMSPGEFLALAPVSYVAVAAGVVAPVWGALIRGVV